MSCGNWRSANDAGEASGLAANWVAGEKGHNTDRDEFEYYINICNQLVNTAEAGIPSGVGMYQVKQFLRGCVLCTGTAPPQQSCRAA